MAAATGSMLMFTVMAALAKHLSASHSVVEIAFYRNLIGSLPFLALAFLAGRRDILTIRKPGLLITRSVLGAVSTVATFGAFSLMPMAETATLLFTASLWAPILGVLFLHEHVGLLRWVAVIIGFIGVVVMMNPQADVNFVGAAAAITAALTQAVMGIMLRHMRTWESPETMALYVLLIGAALLAIGMPFAATALAWQDVPLLIGLGLSGALAQWLLSVSYRHAPATIVAVCNYTNIVWATLLGWLIWKDWPAGVVLAGAGIVIGANLLILWRESRSAKEHANPEVA